MKKFLIISIFLSSFYLSDAQTGIKGEAVSESALFNLYQLDIDQKTLYQDVREDLTLSLSNIEALKNDEPLAYFEKRAALIYKAKMEMKSSLNPEQRRLWREREDAISKLKESKKLELSQMGMSEVEIQKELTNLDVF